MKHEENNRPVKEAWEGYKRPTPKFWRRLGDSLLAVSAMGTGWGIVDDMKWLALSFLFVGVVGKFLTNFFKESK